MVLILLLFGQDMFNLHYKPEETPFYADQKYVDRHPEYSLWDPTPKCYMYTIVFQAFVFMQIFNLLNARNLGDKDLNIFRNIFASWTFFIMVTITAVG